MAEETVKVEAPVEVIASPPPQPPLAVEVVEKEVTPVAVEEAEPKKIDSQLSFKEETNVVSDLPESQRKSLEEFKKLILDALQKHELSSDPLPPVKEEVKKEAPKTEEALKPDETPKTEEPLKVEETPKTEEAPKTEETPKTEEPLKIEETHKKEETLKIEETPEKEETPKTEEAPKTIVVEMEKTVEAIKETIVEVVAPVEEATPVAEEAVAEEVVIEPEEVSIWGIPLLADERSDVILLKFLRARDFKVKEALTMLRNTVKWRKEIGVDALLDEDLGNDYEKVVFTHGHDKQGRPVCYNVFGEFQNKELYQNTFSDAEKRKKFLNWLIQFLEKTIRTLDFSPTGINSFVLVNDLKNSPGYGKRDLYKVVDKFLEILQDNYPEFVFKQVCSNVSWWYLAYNWIYLTVISPRSKSKFVFASPSKTPETLFKYISPEQVPIQFGGHSKDGDHEFSSADSLTEVTIKPGSKHPIEFALTEAAELVWELRVIGWEVNYGAEYLPEKEGGYTLNIAKPKKLTATSEPVLCDSFKATESGKVVITIDNHSSKKKMLLYRSKIKASV